MNRSRRFPKPIVVTPVSLGAGKYARTAVVRAARSGTASETEAVTYRDRRRRRRSQLAGGAETDRPTGEFGSRHRPRLHRGGPGRFAIAVRPGIYAADRTPIDHRPRAAASVIDVDPPWNTRPGRDFRHDMSAKVSVLSFNGIRRANREKKQKNTFFERSENSRSPRETTETSTL